MSDSKGKVSFTGPASGAILKDDLRPSKCQDVILALTVLRRIDSVLEVAKDNLRIVGDGHA